MEQIIVKIDRGFAESSDISNLTFFLRLDQTPTVKDLLTFSRSLIAEATKMRNEEIDRHNAYADEHMSKYPNSHMRKQDRVLPEQYLDLMFSMTNNEFSEWELFEEYNFDLAPHAEKITKIVQLCGASKLLETTDSGSWVLEDNAIESFISTYVSIVEIPNQ